MTHDHPRLSLVLVAALFALARPLPAAEPPPTDPTVPSFLHDVEPLLTRLGCNQGACHGKNAGQNGFRLSLRGYAPEFDHSWITRELHGRRISTAAPEHSLLLQKATAQAPHEGGKLLSPGTREYALLHDWLKAGAPGPRTGEPEVRRLRLLPERQTLRPGQSLPLAVQAEYADGRTRDVTWLTRFDSNDPGIAAVDPRGTVTLRRPGETAVRASFLDQVAVAVFSCPHDAAVAPDAFRARHNFIDDHVFAKLAALKIEPSPLCTDEEFLRRASLDLTGTLPTPDEVRRFLADSSPDNRSRLIDSLLARPEFNDYWALMLADLFQNRKERDHDVRGPKNVRAFHAWIRAQLAANRPWDALARDVLTASGPASTNPAVGYFVVTVGEQREAHRSEVVASVAQAFLGTRIGCAQCHNHPLERYTQDDYYHFAACFSRIRLDRKEPKDGTTSLTVSAPDANQNKAPIGVTQPRTGRFMAPQPLDRTPLTVAPGDDPRARLAAWITDPANEAFAGAMVNRVWKHFLGAGLVEPVDDLRATNPPSNPELWQALVKDFVAHKYDLRHLMRTILASRTYQLSSASRPGNATDTRFCSHYSARRLPAEVLLDALGQATGVPDAFPGYPEGVRAIQVPDPSVRSTFLTLFGRSDRVTACACERNGDVTLPQLLHLQNGEAVTHKIRDANGRLARLLAAKKSDAEIADDLFLATLSRLPAPAEADAVRKALADGSPRDEVFRDLFWALLNSKEFTFNH